MTTQINQLSVKKFSEIVANSEKHILIDVREAWEIDLAKVPNSLDIPMHLIPLKIDEIPKNTHLIVMCHHGGRSQQVAQFLAHHGFAQVSNLSGGIHAYSLELDSTIPTY